MLSIVSILKLMCSETSGSPSSGQKCKTSCFRIFCFFVGGRKDLVCLLLESQLLDSSMLTLWISSRLDLSVPCRTPLATCTWVLINFKTCRLHVVWLLCDRSLVILMIRYCFHAWRDEWDEFREWSMSWWWWMEWSTEKTYAVHRVLNGQFAQPLFD